MIITLSQPFLSITQEKVVLKINSNHSKCEDGNSQIVRSTMCLKNNLVMFRRIENLCYIIQS